MGRDVTLVNSTFKFLSLIEIFVEWVFKIRAPIIIKQVVEAASSEKVFNSPIFEYLNGCSTYRWVISAKKMVADIAANFSPDPFGCSKTRAGMASAGQCHRYKG